MRLPLEMSAWMVGGPMWNTRVFTTQGGDVTRLGLWDYPLHKFDISAGMRMVPDAAKTKLFHMRARGKLYGFRVLDPHDFQVGVGEGFLIETDEPGIYQLVKRYTEDGDTFQRIIKKPIPGTVTVYNLSDAVPDDPVDYSTGLVEIDADDVAGISDLRWVGAFDTPMCFTDDWLQIGMNTGGLLNWNNAGVLEVRRIDASFGTPPPLTDVVYFPPAPTPAPAPPAPAPGPGPAPAPGPGESGMTAGTSYTLAGGGADQRYYIDVGTGLSELIIEGIGASGSVHYDVYVKLGALPTTTDYDSTFDVSAKTTVDDLISSPTAGRYHILVVYAGGSSGSATLNAKIVTALTSGVASTFAVTSGLSLLFSIDTTSATNLHAVVAGLGPVSPPSSSYGQTLWKHGSIPNPSGDGSMYGANAADITPSSGREYFRINISTTSGAGGGSITVTAT